MKTIIHNGVPIEIPDDISDELLQEIKDSMDRFRLGTYYKPVIREKTTERILELATELSRISLQKKDKAALTKKEKDIIQDIFWGQGVDTYNRFQYFWQVRNKLAHAQYWYALAIAYTDSDNLYEIRNQVKRAFRANEREREFLMTAGEQRALAKLPDEVTIYRAMTNKEASGKTFGVSWTLSKKVAEFFRDKYLRNHATNHLEKVVKEKVVQKSEIIALFNGRQEKEIIYIN